MIVIAVDVVLRLNLEVTLVVIDRLEDVVILDELVHEVVGVNLHVIDSISHGLVDTAIFTGAFLTSLHAHHGELAITVTSET